MESFDLDFTCPKSASFLFFIFWLWRLSNHLSKILWKKNNHFHNEYLMYSFFLHFHKDLTSKNFWQWNHGLFKKMKKLRFLASDFDKCRRENILNSTNLSNMARATLILKDCDIASYPCWNYRLSNLLFQISNRCEKV